ncbi:MAG: porphobilinogen synthase [Cytophagales bacterium]|nr:porphobilinogen synthase [Bernardetiaceae bacterium]MDW8204674.1 porphobilinogen synthase [Cytophagales bacterium]
MLHRPRRNRKAAPIRKMVQETHLTVENLIYPLFLTEGENLRVPIRSMPGIVRFSPDEALREIETCLALGLQVFAPFPHIADNLKDKFASESWREDNLYVRAIRLIKERFPEAVLVTDVAMDPYSSDGHDGLVENGEILNDATLEILAKMAIAQAQAGADILGPSDMMDGRVRFIREALDKQGFTSVSIMSYTVKYASAFYGPFRDALDSAPRAGDKKTYQMNPANAREALLEATLDASEGADFLMVKPALAYLDIIRLLKDNFHLPIAAYNVSGEYAMLKAAAANGWINGEQAMYECLLSIRRAGATAILTYFAKEFAQLVNDQQNHS